VLSDASDALALRLQLLGALPRDAELSVFRFSRHETGPEINRPDREAPTLTSRVQSVGHYLLGLLWTALWQRARALTAFNTAAEVNPLAASPHLHVALLQSANNRDDLAIASYRRALEANKRWVLMRPLWVQRLTRAYLRRADALVARRKKRAALSLLDEIASLDLRLADLDLRLAMTRRRDRLLVDRARRRLSRP
jgi:tetratricopeptide (TPR) repeat protein